MWNISTGNGTCICWWILFGYNEGSIFDIDEVKLGWDNGSVMGYSYGSVILNYNNCGT